MSTTTVACDSELGELEVVRGAPGPGLRAHVRGYCGYFESAGPTRRVQLPSDSVGVIVGFGPPIGVAYPHHHAGSTARVSSFVAGLHDSPAVAESAGWQHGVQVDLTPIGAHMLLGVPMDAVANRVVELECLLGKLAARLAEQLHDATSWTARFQMLEALLASRLAAARDPSPAVAWAWRRLSETGGRLGIAALAGELGSSRQYLAARFREDLGLPPKTVARIVRFQRAVGLLERRGRPALATIAHECGYSDQAHFNRDFRELAGATPTEHLARRPPEVAGAVDG